MQRGDLETAAALLERSASVDSWNGTMHWHQRDRRRLLLARHRLAAGDADEAALIAQQVQEENARRGAGRYEVLAAMVRAQAGAVLGERLDHDLVDVDLARLDKVAGLEAWWYTADLARFSGIDRWRHDAQRRAAKLVKAAGPYGEELSNTVADHLAWAR